MKVRYNQGGNIICTYLLKPQKNLFREPLFVHAYIAQKI